MYILTRIFHISENGKNFITKSKQFVFFFTYDVEIHKIQIKKVYKIYKRCILYNIQIQN